MDIGVATDTSAEEAFHRTVDALDAPAVLELGTLRWERDRPTHHEAWVPHASRYVKADIAAGIDVDIVADAHELTSAFEVGEFDAVIAISVFEHLRRPWDAVNELAAILKPGGVALVMTHQTFPLHGYPHDYFRFSIEALEELFAPPKWATLAAAYAYPCRIVPPAEVTRWNPAAESYLNVEGCFRRSSN